MFSSLDEKDRNIIIENTIFNLTILSKAKLYGNFDLQTGRLYNSTR